MMRRLIVFVLIIAIAGSTFGQSGDRVLVPYHTVIELDDTTRINPGNVAGKFEKIEINKGDKLYERLGFSAATQRYASVAKKRKANDQVLANMANSFRMNGETEEAEYWYSRFIQTTTDSSHYLNYAQVLKNNNNCETAKKWFEKYRSSLGDNAVFEKVNDCSGLTTLRTYDQIEVENAESLNTKSDDFCAIPFQEGVILTSNRKVKRMYKSHDQWTGESFADLFYAERSETGEFKKAKPLSGNLNTPLHEGVASVNSAGSFMAFTRNEKKRSGKKQLKELKIYGAYKGADGYWSDAEKLSINGNKSSSCHPALSPDNMKIYFTSNRAGGFGGLDLYVSDFKNGEWSNPKNLGPEINTAGNELFPFVDSEGVLYFASNGHKGFGGLDVFSTKYEDASWSVPQHLGQPINSTKDDFGFYIDDEKSTGYLSSNREDGKGKDDIYTFKINGSWPFDKKYFMARIFTFEKDTDFPLEGVKVVITEKLKTDEGVAVNSYWITEEDGTFDFKIKLGNSYLFEFRKEGYTTFKKYKTATDLLEDASFGLSARTEKYRDFKMVLENPDAKGKYEARINNLKNKEIMLLPFSQLGTALASLECGGEFEIELLNDGEVFDMMHLRLPENCDQQKIGELVFKNTKDLADTNAQLEVSGQLPSDKKPEDWTEKMFKEYFLGDDAANFKVGQVIALRDVFYDYDQYDIRPDASLDLERVAAMMKQFSSIKLSLEAHTDNRGSADYNSKLSNRRAYSARQYLINKGISPDRLMIRGFGEERPRIDCEKCSDIDHQFNRRTEIRVFKL